MKRIKLTQGRYTLVDDEDFEKLNKYKWCFMNRGYAERRSEDKIILMHREILKAKKEEYCDHINGNKLDNRHSNLRICTHSQNMWNSKKHKDNTSGFKGVHWSKKLKKWYSTIQKNGIAIYLGDFDDPIPAALAYNKAAKKYHGEFARLNKIE